MTRTAHLPDDAVRLRQVKGMPVMFKSTSTSLILLGILAVIVGIIAIAWPGVTILALVILFAVYAFTGAGLQAAQAFSSRTAGPVFGHLLLGLIDLAAGVVALAWPAPTTFVLVIVVAAWALVGGIAEFFAGFQSGETAGTRARPPRCSSRRRKPQPQDRSPGGRPGRAGLHQAVHLNRTETGCSGQHAHCRVHAGDGPLGIP